MAFEHKRVILALGNQCWNLKNMPFLVGFKPLVPDLFLEGSGLTSSPRQLGALISRIFDENLV